MFMSFTVWYSTLFFVMENSIDLKSSSASLSLWTLWQACCSVLPSLQFFLPSQHKGICLLSLYHEYESILILL